MSNVRYQTVNIEFWLTTKYTFSYFGLSQIFKKDGIQVKNGLQNLILFCGYLIYVLDHSETQFLLFLCKSFICFKKPKGSIY